MAAARVMPARCSWRWLWLHSAALLLLLPRCECAAARLYTEQDPLVLLSRDTLRATLTDSPGAWLVQFYSSWCGHCIQYSGTWKALARDVRDWQGAIAVAVFDCALEENFDLCREYGIKFYPTFKYFKAHGGAAERGTIYRGGDREIPSVRQLMVNILQNHTRTERPDQCPELRPYSSVELLPLLGKKSDHYTALIIEDPQSYTGREVMLDLLPYSGLVVHRAVSSDRPLLDTLGITELPAVHLLQPDGSHRTLHTEKRLRFFFTSLLRTLPGVQRKSLTNSSVLNPQKGALSSLHTQPWRDFNRSQVYAADLESALHYLLRVELASHSSLEGDELRTFKDLVTLLAKLYPGGGAVVKLMETLSDWLLSLPLEKIPYQAVLDLVDNKMKISGVFLGSELRWVGCQGSAPGFRGYPCALWTLFHVLSVHRRAAPSALRHTALEAEPAPVLDVMRRYIRTFFGCEECGKNFEKAALSEGAAGIKSPDEEVMWLWNQHNEVNYRLTGSLSDDPLFPKGAWPPPTLCAACHEENRGLHAFNQQEVLTFLLQHFGEANLSRKYALEPAESEKKKAKEKERGDEKEGDEKKKEGDEKKKEGDEEKKEEEGNEEKKKVGDKEEERTKKRGDKEENEDASKDFVAKLEGHGEEKEVKDSKEERLSSSGEQQGNRTLALGFNSVDMSLCLLLYVGSCLFLMLLFFFFRVRSRRWKLRTPKLAV
ncbi:sulfhydryl oxidase 2 [Eucyclogobius newberryi]|uniref:sulfhydryl oxidase 2 n=1 Tax=Eucyclogobius newberryi TaxID=166745 RepID=UPI003B59A435